MQAGLHVVVSGSGTRMDTKVKAGSWETFSLRVRTWSSPASESPCDGAQWDPGGCQLLAVHVSGSSSSRDSVASFGVEFMSGKVG